MQKQQSSQQGGWMQQFFGVNRKQDEQHLQYNSYDNNSLQFGLGGGQQNIINQNISNENTPSNSFDMATAYQMSLINQQNNNFEQNQESSENVLKRQKEF